MLDTEEPRKAEFEYLNVAKNLHLNTNKHYIAACNLTNHIA